MPRAGKSCIPYVMTATLWRAERAMAGRSQGRAGNHSGPRPSAPPKARLDAAGLIHILSLSPRSSVVIICFLPTQTCPGQIRRLDNGSATTTGFDFDQPRSRKILQNYYEEAEQSVQQDGVAEKPGGALVVFADSPGDRLRTSSHRISWASASGLLVSRILLPRAEPGQWVHREIAD